MKDQEQRESSSQEPQTIPMDQLDNRIDHDTKEEYAAELSVPYAEPMQAPVQQESRSASVEESGADSSSGVMNAWVGYTALVLAVISLFIYPVLFGSVGALLGMLAYSQGQKALGVWSVVLGMVSFASYFLLAPLYS